MSSSTCIATVLLDGLVVGISSSDVGVELHVVVPLDGSTRWRALLSVTSALMLARALQVAAGDADQRESSADKEVRAEEMRRMQAEFLRLARREGGQ